MKIPTLNELNKTLDILKESSHEGIRGVVRIDSKQSGPVLGITVCTHGNEPCGLAAAKVLFDIFNQNSELIKGTLYIVLNNLDATNRYFKATTDDEKRALRFIDINFNRLPENTLKLFNDDRYEIRRAQELQRIWEHFDFGLDIHSTTQDNGPMLVATGDELPPALIKGFPIEKIISNIDCIQIGKPVAYFYGKSKARAKTFGIECGAHTSLITFQRSVKSAMVLLQNLHMLPGEKNDFPREYEEYFVNASIMFPNESYELVKLFKNFEFVPKGTILACGDGPDIISLNDCHTLFASKTKPDRIDEEVMFLSNPVRSYKIV